ncbi:MAG: caspase family protein [Bacteroidales bacterium]|nr:caspase family protein [Bacteroidales bacterium]
MKNIYILLFFLVSPMYSYSQLNAYIISDESNMGKEISVKIFENKLKESLIENSFQIVNNKSSADYIYNCKLTTSQGSEYQGVYTSFANAEFDVSNANGKHLFAKVYTNIKAGGLNYEHAGSKAIEKVSDKIIAEFEVFLLTADLFETDNRINENLTDTTVIQSKDKTPPEIKIISPTLFTRSSDPVTKEKQLKIKGIATDESGIFSVIVNNQETSLSADGYFSISLKLKIGENKFVVIAEDIKGNKSKKEYIVTRSAKPFSGDNNTSLSETNTGTYFALIIGVNEYTDVTIPSLNNPVSDAQSLYDVITEKYSFKEENINFIKNSTRRDIIIAFDNLSKTVTENDNLLIFFAGHGYWDEKMKQGYWLPADASYDNSVDWIRNSTIQGYIGSINSKHTLLIADACFSGGIFKTRKAFNDASEGINKLYELSSRKAMTSGTLKEVPDESVFLKYLVKRLNENPEKYISAQDLFTSFRTAVLNNSPNVPQYGTIKDTGDEGGDFIFIKQ